MTTTITMLFTTTTTKGITAEVITTIIIMLFTSIFSSGHSGFPAPTSSHPTSPLRILLKDQQQFFFAAKITKILRHSPLYQPPLQAAASTMLTSQQDDDDHHHGDVLQHKQLLDNWSRHRHSFSLRMRPSFSKANQPAQIPRAGSSLSAHCLLSGTAGVVVRTK